jgi:hypothetical protein
VLPLQAVDHRAHIAAILHDDGDGVPAWLRRRKPEKLSKPAGCARVFILPIQHVPDQRLSVALAVIRLAPGAAKRAKIFQHEGLLNRLGQPTCRSKHRPRRRLFLVGLASMSV